MSLIQGKHNTNTSKHSLSKQDTLFRNVIYRHTVQMFFSELHNVSNPSWGVFVFNVTADFSVLFIHCCCRSFSTKNLNVMGQIEKR